MGFPDSVFFIRPRSSAPTEEAQSRLAKAMEIDFMDVSSPVSYDNQLIAAVHITHFKHYLLNLRDNGADDR